MKKNKFLVLSMGLITDTDTPKIKTPEVVIIKNELNDKGKQHFIHMPISVQKFTNREEFVTEMTTKSLKMWEMLEDIFTKQD